MQQKVIFGLEGIQVNATQIIANNQIISLQEIKKVKHGINEPKRWLAHSFVFAGAVLFNLHEALIIVASFSMMIGVMALFSAKTVYTVIVETIHGEHEAFVSESSDTVNTVIRAINTAMINRGYI